MKPVIIITESLRIEVEDNVVRCFNTSTTLPILTILKDDFYYFHGNVKNTEEVFYELEKALTELEKWGEFINPKR